VFYSATTQHHYIVNNMKFWLHVNKNSTRCNGMQKFIYSKATLHVSGFTAPNIRSTKTVTTASGAGHNTCTATPLQRGLIGITLEGSSCTSIMTCTGGCGYSFSTPDVGCCETRNMHSSFSVNKYLHTFASGWIFIQIALRCTEPRV